MEIGIYGCVTNPGKRDFRGARVSVAKALREAGGVKQNLASGIISIRSWSKRKQSQQLRDQFNMRRHASRAARLFLHDGDTIVVQFNGTKLLRTWQENEHDR